MRKRVILFSLQLQRASSSFIDSDCSNVDKACEKSGDWKIIAIFARGQRAQARSRKGGAKALLFKNQEKIRGNWKKTDARSFSVRFLDPI
jgi:hypothetical protein